MKREDLISSFFWVGLGAFLCKRGYDLDLGNLSEPGSGFIIFWMGIVMMGLSIGLFFQTFFQKTVPEKRKPIWSGVRWQKLILVLVSLLLYAYALIPIGFLLSTCLLLVLLYKFIEPQKWYIAISGAILTVLVTYVIFYIWLGCQLPKGMLESFII